jgi:hypothetical protein
MEPERFSPAFNPPCFYSPKVILLAPVVVLLYYQNMNEKMLRAGIVRYDHLRMIFLAA